MKYRAYLKIVWLLTFCTFIAPRLLSSALGEVNSPAFYAVTIPKCGTHLVTKALKLLLKKRVRRYNSRKVARGQLPSRFETYVWHSHAYYTRKGAQAFADRNVKGLLMIRDPRDQLISRCFWALDRSGLDRRSIDQEDFSRFLHAHIKGVKGFYEQFLPWGEHPLFYTVKFERLVGDEGGGDSRTQRAELEAIARHLNVSSPPGHIEKCVRKLFGGTATFRKGQIGSWKRYFSPDDKKLFKQVAGQLLIDLGYEKDLAW
jgi:sulfotransferase 6B1